MRREVQASLMNSDDIYVYNLFFTFDPMVAAGDAYFDQPRCIPMRHRYCARG